MKKISVDKVASWWFSIVAIVFLLSISWVSPMSGLFMLATIVTMAVVVFVPFVIVYCWNVFTNDDEEQSHEDYNSYL